MAVILYKPGKGEIVRGIECCTQKCDVELFRNELKAGWFLSPEECYEEVDETETETIGLDETENDDDEEDETPNSQINIEELSDDDIRATAQKAGINNWHVKTIENLKKELEGNAS